MAPCRFFHILVWVIAVMLLFEPQTVVWVITVAGLLLPIAYPREVSKRFLDVMYFLIPFLIVFYCYFYLFSLLYRTDISHLKIQSDASILNILILSFCIFTVFSFLAK